MHKLSRISGNSWVFSWEHDEGIDECFDVATDFLEAGDLAAAEQELRKLLDVCPDHVDALHHMSILLKDGGRKLESYLFSREAVRIGLDTLPAEFSWLTSKLEWGYIKNRPFLRAYHGLALALRLNGHWNDAAEIFARLVSVSPNDNLGARVLLFGCMLRGEDWRGAVDLANKYGEDIDPVFTFSKAIAQIALDMSDEAEESLKLGMKHFPNVAAELLKTTHTRPKSMNSVYAISGGLDEAFRYWEEYRTYWHSKSDALRTLRRLKRASNRD